MRSRTKMMLMQGGRRGGDNRGGDNEARNEYERARMEMRMARDEYDRARSEYQYARNERSGSRGVRNDGSSYPIYPEGRFRDRDGREHYDNGRFAPMRGNYGGRVDSYGYGYPHVPPIYDGGEPMNRIGFVNPDEFRSDGYGSRMEMPRMNEMEHRKGKMMSGHADSDMIEPMTHERAVKWVKGMKNADGTTGPHWGMDQTKQVMEQQNIQCDEVEFFVAMNMMYSDYCKVAKKHNCSTTEFYAAMAKAFLDDKDAQPEKLSRYYECIVEH